MDADDPFADIVASYRDDPTIGLGKMMRAEGLQVHGKVFAFPTGRDLVLKLPAETIASLIDAGRARPYVAPM